MMCKRCATSVADEDNFCKVCGKRLKEHNAIKKIIGIFVVVVGITACVSYIYLDQKGFFDSDNPELAGEDSLPPDELISAANPNPVDTPIPAATADFSKDINEVQNILSVSYYALEEYMLEYSYTPFVSNKGYLFDMAANRTVSIADLTASDKLDPIYREEKVFFLYLRPSDFAEFNEVEFDGSDDLAVFSAYETKTGVALFNKKYNSIIYRENLNKVFEMYGSNDGEAVKPSSSDKKYNEIVDAVSLYDSGYGKFDVRYMSADDRYAVAVLSPKSDSTVLLGYVLEKTDSGYDVVNNNFENYEKPIVEVNSAIPYMNIELMPKFNIKKTELLASARFTAIATTLKNQGEVKDSDFPIEFVSGTNEYVFIVFNSGVKFFGVNKGNTGWNIKRVDNWASAELMLNKEEKEPPSYIFRQE